MYVHGEVSLIDRGVRENIELKPAEGESVDGRPAARELGWSLTTEPRARDRDRAAPDGWFR